ncbi:protein FAM210A-like [Limulus polyphemus]|uniref:Protein FAM210A-like n=1 Tax=Limulus polyphemus TaxID=6850 RepID=A0ABM1BRY8_LIMPO|nr:protein FAM210A-like [Limulus polyphemus]
MSVICLPMFWNIHKGLCGHYIYRVRPIFKIGVETAKHYEWHLRPYITVRPNIPATRDKTKSVHVGITVQDSRVKFNKEIKKGLSILQKRNETTQKTNLVNLITRSTFGPMKETAFLKLIHVCSYGTRKTKESVAADECISEKPGDEQKIIEDNMKKLSLIQRYKKMLKEYWYVLIPVHCVTSLVWISSFYYAAKCGFDIVPYMEAWNVPESILEPVRDKGLGHLAVASVMYKIVTPARYTVTLAGTTLSIKYLSKKGYLRPMPSSQQIKTMIKTKRDIYRDKHTSKQDQK